MQKLPRHFFSPFFKKKLFIYFQGLSFLSVCLNSVCKNVCGVELQLHYWAPSSKLRGSGIIREDGRGERGGGWGLVQSTPLSKATCAATHSRIHEEEEKQKEKQVAPGINSQFLFSSFSLFSFLSFFFGTMTHGGVLSFKTCCAD